MSKKSNEEKSTISEKAVDATFNIQGQLPDLTLNAIVSGREIGFKKIGKPAMYLFHTRESARQAAAINHAIRDVEIFQSFDDLLIANVVDLHSIPKPLYSFARRIMRDSYQKSAAIIAVERAPEDFIIILPDWDGSITKAVGLENVDKEVGVVLVDSKGEIHSIFRGETGIAQALIVLELGELK